MVRRTRRSRRLTHIDAPSQKRDNRNVPYRKEEKMKTSILDSWRSAGDAIRLGTAAMRGELTVDLPAFRDLSQDESLSHDPWKEAGEAIADDWRRVGDYLRTAMNRWDESHE